VKKYDWGLILVMSIPGPVMGLLTVYGIISIGAEKWCWLGISVFAAVTISQRVKENAFGHGALVGLLLGVTSKLIQAVWAGAYAAHNPVLQEKLSGPIDGVQFQYRMLMLVPFVGIINAILVGLMSHFTWKARQRVQKGRPE
jgi:hypothetical protein